MRAFLPGGSTLFYIVILVGLLYGVVWFSGTRYADTLRSVGLPIPYCTTHPLVSLCEMDYTSFSPSLIKDSNVVNAFLFTRPSDGVLNALCALSKDGSNVRIVLSALLKSDSNFLSALDACKIKYRFSTDVSSNELSTGNCYISFTGKRGVYTCCAAVVTRFDKYFEEVWKHASP